MIPIEKPSHNNQKANIVLCFWGNEVTAMVRDLGQFTGHPDWLLAEGSWFHLIVCIWLHFHTIFNTSIKWKKIFIDCKIIEKIDVAKHCILNNKHELILVIKAQHKYLISDY